MQAMGAVDPLSWGLNSFQFDADYEGTYEKVKGQIMARPFDSARIGQDYQGRLDLGNTRRDRFPKKLEMIRELVEYQERNREGFARLWGALYPKLG